MAHNVPAVMDAERRRTVTDLVSAIKTADTSVISDIKTSLISG